MLAGKIKTKQKTDFSKFGSHINNPKIRFRNLLKKYGIENISNFYKIDEVVNMFGTKTTIKYFHGFRVITSIYGVKDTLSTFKLTPKQLKELISKEKPI